MRLEDNIDGIRQQLSETIEKTFLVQGFVMNGKWQKRLRHQAAIIKKAFSAFG